MGFASFVAGDMPKNNFKIWITSHGCQAEIYIKSNVDIDKTNDNE
jgi:hypothetical protein